MVWAPPIKYPGYAYGQSCKVRAFLLRAEDIFGCLWLILLEGRTPLLSHSQIDISPHIMTLEKSASLFARKAFDEIVVHKVCY